MKTMDVITCNTCGRQFVSLGEKCDCCYDCSSDDLLVEKKTINYNIEEYVPFSISEKEAKEMSLNFLRNKDDKSLKVIPFYYPYWKYITNCKCNYNAYQRVFGTTISSSPSPTVSWGYVGGELSDKYYFLRSASNEEYTVLSFEYIDTSECKKVDKNIEKKVFASIPVIDSEYYINGIREFYEKHFNEVVEQRHGDVHKVKFKDFDFNVTERKMILLPLYIVKYNLKNKEKTLVINGVSGEIHSKRLSKKAKDYELMSKKEIIVFIIAIIILILICVIY